MAGLLADHHRRAAADRLWGDGGPGPEAGDTGGARHRAAGRLADTRAAGPGTLPGLPRHQSAAAGRAPSGRSTLPWERCEGPIFLRPGGTRWTSTTRTGSCAEWPARPGSPSPSARTLHHAFLTLCVTKRHPCAQADLPVVTEHGQRSKSSTRTSPPFGADIGSNATVILPPRSG